MCFYKVSHSTVKFIKALRQVFKNTFEVNEFEINTKRLRNEHKIDRRPTGQKSLRTSDQQHYSVIFKGTYF